MKRRVYVMDCGDFVKIGVSVNVGRRASQIPYKVRKLLIQVSGKVHKEGR